jgi:hypothetical protein
MRINVKVAATIVAAALAVTPISVPAFADDQQKPTGLGIFGALVGPAAIAATTTGAHWHHLFLAKKFYFPKTYWGWKKAIWTKHVLQYKGWEVDKYVGRYKIKLKATKESHSHHSGNQGKFVVACIMGSAVGAISAAARKATALGNPPSWRSQAEHEKIVASGYEKQFELTNDEAWTAVALCGLGSLALHWNKAAPAVVRAGG